MSKYYVRKEKMKKLEAAFKADLRWLKKNDICFNMVQGAYFQDSAIFPEEKSKWTVADRSCGVCLVGAHLIKNQPPNVSSYTDEVATAAADLEVNPEWLGAMYVAYGRDLERDLTGSAFPQATKLAHRLREYAKKIGLGPG